MQGRSTRRGFRSTSLQLNQTLDGWCQNPCQISTSSVPDSPVRLSALLEKRWDSMTREDISLLKSLGLQSEKDLKSYSLKTSVDCSATTKEGHSEESSIRYMKWGMMSNGRLLTANISFHRAEREYSLSDILETNPHRRYFLSTKAVTAARRHMLRNMAKGNGFGIHILEQLIPAITKAGAA